MSKRERPEISLRGKGRALFEDLAEWVTAAPTPEPPREAAPAEAVGSPAPPPHNPAPMDREPEGSAEAFAFMALEAARAAPVEPISWAPPPPWPEEPRGPSADGEGIAIDPQAPMRALRIPGLLAGIEPEGPEVTPHGAATPETRTEEAPMETPRTVAGAPERAAGPPRAPDEARVRALNGRIDDLYRRIANGAIPDPSAADQALAWLKQAREALLTPEGYDEAEYYHSLAYTRYAIARRLWRWSYTYGLFVFLWGLAWLGAYLWALTAGRGYSAQVVPPGYEGIWEPIMWGGLGGVCGIFYSLYWHVAIKRDFDRQYVMWYLVQPLLGSMIGMIIYMVITVGFLTVQGTPNPANPLFMYLIAFVAGFRQRFFLELIDRIVQTFTPNPRSAA